MKRIILLSALASVMAAQAVTPASAASDCPGFLPPNDLSIPVGSSDDKGIAQAQFNAVLDSVERLYAPVVAAKGGVLEVRRLWTDATVNASAMHSGNRYILNMYGGLARHAAVTMDGFALVACHELGHHLGGAPKIGGGDWASNEGQADYYANLKCLRKVFAEAGSAAFTRAAASDEAARRSCEAAFSGTEDRALCYRSALAGKSVAALFMALRSETTEPRFDTPDPAVVSSMFDKHPGTQCRLDTYLQGSLCTQPLSSVLSDTKPSAGTCTRSAGFAGGFRPLCWYKPASASELLPPAALAFPGEDEDGVIPAGAAFSALRSADPRGARYTAPLR